MKIKRLWISEYKNIKGLEIEFKSDLVSLLVGRNGLGKSNIIEILALIFRDLDMVPTIEEFKEWSYTAGHFEFEIEYECKRSDLKILCKDEDFTVLRKPLGGRGDYTELDFEEFKADRREKYLPDYIIGYYSGENKRIREIIRPYEEKVWEDLKKNKEVAHDFRPMFFAENHHAQLILLTLLLYKEQGGQPDFEGRVEDLIERFASFSSLEQIDLTLRQPTWFKPKVKSHQRGSMELLVENLLAREQDGWKFPFWNTKGKADKIISFFYDSNKDGAEPLALGAEDGQPETLKFELDKEHVAGRVKGEFGHASAFLDALESLFVIDSIHELRLKVRSEPREIVFDFAHLSEGEQQIIAVLGLLLITGQKDCLFLFDEPDTHLNPAWQRDYIELLRRFNLNEENGHIILATHSPFLVQAADHETDVVLFRQLEDGTIEVDQDDRTIENWRIDHVLLSEYFGLESLRPKAVDEFMTWRRELLAKGLPNEGDLAELRRRENELGSLPSGETIEEVEDKILLRSAANAIREQRGHDPAQ